MDKRIIYDNGNGVSIVAPSSILTIEEVAAKDAPPGAVIVDISSIPTERIFRNAWIKSGDTIQTDIPKAKLIAHALRRVKRQELMAPLDIEATIPARAVVAEAAREAIRDADAITQGDIDAAMSEDELKSILLVAGIV